MPQATRRWISEKVKSLPQSNVLPFSDILDAEMVNSALALAGVTFKELFALEVEFHRRLRTEAPGTGDAGATHTSCALRSGYEQLLKRVGRVTDSDIEALRERLSLAGDARDVLSARDSVMKILGIRPLAT